MTRCKPFQVAWAAQKTAGFYVPAADGWAAGGVAAALSTERAETMPGQRQTLASGLGKR